MRVFNPRLRVLNLMAGPGVGKSTVAAGVFSVLKYMGTDVELVTEVAKDATYASDVQALSNQFYMTASQEMRQWRLRGQCDLVVTDSPILQGIAYCPQEDAPTLIVAARHMAARYDNYNVLLKRGPWSYQTMGRNESFREAQKKDAIIRDIWRAETGRTPSLEVPAHVNSIKRIVEWFLAEANIAADMPNIPEFPA